MYSHGTKSEARFSRKRTESRAATEEKSRGETLEATIRRSLLTIVDRDADEIRARFPKPEVRRRNMGYPLDYLVTTREHGWNLAKFLCGSEGTLALVTEATLQLVPRPQHIGLVAAHFASVDEALRCRMVSVVV